MSEVLRRLFKRKRALVDIGYYNGPCPMCTATYNIAIRIKRDPISRQVFAWCPNCGSEIFEGIDRKLVAWY